MHAVRSDKPSSRNNSWICSRTAPVATVGGPISSGCCSIRQLAYMLLEAIRRLALEGHGAWPMPMSNTLRLKLPQGRCGDLTQYAGESVFCSRVLVQTTSDCFFHRCSPARAGIIQRNCLSKKRVEINHDGQLCLRSANRPCSTVVGRPKTREMAPSNTQNLTRCPATSKAKTGIIVTSSAPDPELLMKSCGLDRVAVFRLVTILSQ